ncbi:MAG TPA: carboxypeptidase-like regulatory domain-containing protein, partial [Flavobacteriaceae bacterium]|nr:carboxypeptidase-like regulatory domain-containing protein [Flavobacteriaceae bacterium]
LIFLSSLVSFSQNVKGVIIDDSSKTPISYATLRIKNTKLGTYSDSVGNFQFNNFKNETLIVSAIGYKTKEIKIENVQELIYVFLEQEEIQLNEIVIKNNIEKLKWKNVFPKDKVVFPSAILLEGTSIIRKVKLENIEIIKGLRFRLIEPTDDLTVTIRPLMFDNNGLSLLNKDYAKTVQLKKGSLKKLEFEFDNIILIPDNEISIGVEVVSAPNNRNYEVCAQIECHRAQSPTTEVVTILNYKQENGMIFNFDKKLDSDLYFEIKTLK